MVGDRHLRDLPPAPFHVAVRTVRLSAVDPGADAGGNELLPPPPPARLATWNAELVRRLAGLNLSAVRIDATDHALPDSPYDLAVEVELAWGPALRQERCNFAGSFLAWGFLWPFSMTSLADVRDRSYSAPVAATIRLAWVGAEATQSMAPATDLALSLPERQPSVWWKLAAFTPVYFWVPDDAAQRTDALYDQFLDRLAVAIARAVKLGDRHQLATLAWQGDYLEVEAPAGVEVRIVGGIRQTTTPPLRYSIPREADHVRVAVRRPTAEGVEAWTLTLPRPR
ncbi:MAG: hypothetical protein KF830_14470 [Planctomycetes bacterium]|nr:hypothetical protein [Planctomycetota bacterium]